MTMNYNEQQYERVARYLDGLDVRLSDEELGFAQGLRRDEQTLASRLEAELAPAAMERARRRATAAVAHRRHTQWTLRIGSAVATAAAAVLIFAVVLWPSGPMGSGSRTQSDPEFVQMVGEVGQTPSGMLSLMDTMTLDKDQLQEQIDNQNVEVALSADVY